MKDLKQEIVEMVSRINDSWLLEVICRFIRNMVKETKYER